jgi:hypothetical protein
MTDTKAFCTKCIRKVALAHISPMDAACHSQDHGMLIGEDGRCSHCGKSGLVVHYMTPELTE